MATCNQCGQELPESQQKIEDRQWGGWDLNPYSNPANCGLELLATAEEDEAYEFHIVCFWRDLDSGRFFMAADSGCSCPSPFEDVRSVSDLTEVSTIGEGQHFFLASVTSGFTPSSTAALLMALQENLSRW